MANETSDGSDFFRSNRERLGISRFDMAVKLGCTDSAVAGWERGQVPGMKMVRPIAELFSVTPAKVMAAMYVMQCAADAVQA